MARFNTRLAAGVASVFLLVGGPGVAAIADPGGEHSDRDHRSDRGSSNGYDNGHDNRHGNDDRGDGYGRGGWDRDDRGDGYGRGGWDRDDRGDRYGRGRWDRDDYDGGSGDDIARRGSDEGSRTATPDIAESPTVRVGSGRDSVAALTPSTTSGSSGSGSNGAGSTGSGSTGPGLNATGSIEAGTIGPPMSGDPGTANAGSNSPRVTVGNGRSPGVLTDDPEPRWSAPTFLPSSEAPLPSPPLPPAAPPSTSWVERFSTPPDVTQQLGVASATEWSNALWGIAGLLLIPAAGAALGYRQARAAHSAERLGVS